MTATRDAATGIVDRVSGFDGLDKPVEDIQGLVAGLLPDGSRLRDALGGRWLGHPLHPVLTDLVVGSWTGAGILDLLGGRKRRREAADMVGLGLLAAVPTVASGLADWADEQGETRRIGAVHALGNLTAIALQASSYRARRTGRHGAGAALSAIGLGIAGSSAWLGGHLSFRAGIGVDQTVFEEPPTSWTPLIDDEKLEEGALVRRSAGGTGVLLVRHKGKVHAMIDRCSHRGCSLSEGSLDGAAITCPCHGSRFGLDGGVLRGPAISPQPTLETRRRADRIEVRAWRG